MRGQILFYTVFLSQVVLISFYFPRVVLSRLRYVVETYPPSDYPRLYPVPMDVVERAQRNYRYMNLLALLAGLALVVIGVYSPSEDMLNWDSISVLGIYFLLQYSPMIIAATAGFTYFNLMRKTDSRSTRTAQLQRRRLFDFVSPTIVGTAIFAYFAFVLFIIYIRQFEFPWFGGYSNIFGMTAVNVFFAAMIVRTLYGKKKDPYQAYEDRMRQIELVLKILFLSSIMATLFITIAVTLHAFELQHLIPVSLSLYFQLVAVIGFREFRIDNVNFEVYKEEPLVT